jgi:hypothetical protein
MKLFSCTTWVSLIILTLANLGCTTPPPQVEHSEAQRQDAVQAILSEAVYYTNLFDTCVTLGGEAEINAVETQQNWLAVNWPLIAAADVIYSNKMQAATFQYNNQAISPAAIHLAQLARERAQNELSLEQRSPSNKQITCNFRFKKITPENIALSTLPNIAPFVDEVLAQSSATNHPIHAVPSLAGDIATDTPQGRSYFTIFKQLEADCPNAYTLVIVNNWPLETYANFCGDQYMETIECTWGKCAAKAL